jgi:hypothetical protein
MVGFARFMRPLEQMLLEDKTLTALSDRQRFLLYTNSAAQAAEKFQAMPETGSLMQAMAEKLSTLWPEAVEPPYYPAFR